MTKFLDLSDDEKKEYEFTYEQLNIIDRKSSNIVTVSSILIVISTIFVFPIEELFLKLFVIAAILCSLTAVILSLKTMNIEWSDDADTKKLRQVRDERTNAVHNAARLMEVSLVLYVIVLILSAGQSMMIDPSEDIVNNNLQCYELNANNGTVFVCEKPQTESSDLFEYLKFS